MQKFIKPILALIMAGLFLVSFTGIRFVVHYCMACDVSSLHVFEDAGNCCEDQSSLNDETLACTVNPVDAGSCCSGESVSPGNACQNCCHDEVVYVKHDYEVSKDRQPQRVAPVLVDTEVFTWSLFQQHFADKGDLHLFPSTVDPPPRKVARDFVVFTHHLKICSSLLV